MIIVTGSVKARPNARAEVMRISIEHVQRSRREPGCLLHSVHLDVEDADRFVFVEHWVDHDALMVHFRVPESGAFAKALEELAVGTPSIQIFDAAPLSL